MYRFTLSPGWLLHSVALRYRQPDGRHDWPPRPAGENKLWQRVNAGGQKPTRESNKEGVPPPATSGVEAVLFLSREPVTSRKLAQLAGLADGTEARTLVRALNRRYDTEGYAFRVMEVAGGFQLMSRPKFAPWLRRLHGQAEVRLSAPAIETLAVVAYRQPIPRADIEAIRGVQCGEILRQLMERELVRIVGRSEDLGRPFLYGTTRQFLQVFGLRHLDELPRPELIRNDQSPGGDVAVCHRDESHTTEKTSTQTNHSIRTEGETTVTTATNALLSLEEALDEKTRSLRPAKAAKRASDDDEDEEDEDFDDEGDDEDEDDDLEDDEDFDDDFDDEDFDDDFDDDEDLDEDEDLDDEWEEVGDDEDEDADEEEDDEDFDDEEDSEEEDEDDWDEEDDWEDEEDEEDWD